MKILLLEDDLILNEIIEEFLVSLNYEVVTSYDGSDAEELSYCEVYDLYILDVNVPNLNGFNFLKSLRDRDIMSPAIFITSLDSVIDLQKGFECGCNDYIKKPFELKELELRINNLKKQFNIESKSQVELGQGMSYNYDTKSIVNDGYEYKLAKKESKIVEYFIKNPNRVISSDELVSNIWSYEESPTNSTVRTYIKNIRKVIGEEYILTLKGVGYRFNKR